MLALCSLISSVTVLLLVTASIVQLVEGLTFGNALYFTLLTLSTVGFGDITPQTALGKASTAALIIIGAIVIPVQISQLNSYLGERKTVVGDPTPLRGTLHVMVHAKLNDFSGFKVRALASACCAAHRPLCFGGNNIVIAELIAPSVENAPSGLL